MESVKLVNSAVSVRPCDVPTSELLLKRSFDVILALIAIVCLLPFLALAMLAISLDSAGPPVFTQLRVGRFGKLFRIFKLRTMYVGSDSLDFATRPADKRLTRVGVWLRRLNLDELPQLINVLIGDMSIIGVRPLSLVETQFLSTQGGFTKDYPGFIPSFKPGLVGLEQVNRTKDLTYEERFEYNSTYESGWSIAMDLRILLKAMKVCSPVCAVVTLGAVLVCTCLHIH